MIISVLLYGVVYIGMAVVILKTLADSIKYGETFVRNKAFVTSFSLLVMVVTYMLTKNAMYMLVSMCVAYVIAGLLYAMIVKNRGKDEEWDD